MATWHGNRPPCEELAVYCSECGKSVSDSAKFCEACGKSLHGKVNEDAPAIAEVITPSSLNEAPTFSRTRIMNWVIACLLAAGAVTLFLKAGTATAFAIISAVTVSVVSILVLTAIALSPDVVLFFGIPMYVSGSRRKLLQKVALIGNGILGLFGLLGMVACFVTGQYLPMLPMLVYVFPPAINIMMLQRAVRLQYS